MLDEVQRKLVREALSALLQGACEPTKYRAYFQATCSTLESLQARANVQSFHQELYSAAQLDLARIPQVMLSRAQRLDDSVVTLWLVAVLLQDGIEHGDWPSLVRGLSALECHGAVRATCEQGTPLALKQLGKLTVDLERHWRGFEGSLTVERLRVVALLVALEQSPAGTLEEVERGQALANTVSQGFLALQSAKPEDALKSTFDYLLSYLAARAPSWSGASEAQLRSLQACVQSARAGDLAASLSEAVSLAAKTSADLPDEVRALLLVVEALRGKASATELLEALAKSPWLSEKLADQLRGRALNRKFDPFGDAPRRRPDGERPREGVASYFGGARAGYVYQYWKPEDISDVAYSTVGLNLLRLELLLNAKKIPALQLLEGYFRYELAPGGRAEQDKLIQLYEDEASGWQAILAELAADLPGLSDADSLRGPAFGFQRRYFLASAEALKDYWYYDDQTVRLLAPGDKIQTTTVMTSYLLGFRDTSLRDGVPRWGYEGGGFYLDYRKPYTHSRFTNVDRAAIFDASFRGLGGYATGRLFIPSSNRKAPGQLSVNAKFGHAEIVLDDIVATEVLPDDSGVFMFEATAEVQFPVIWWGGFFVGGMGHATYRSFGDYFSGGEADATRVNDQSLNDDFIVGLTAQAGYLL